MGAVRGRWAARGRRTPGRRRAARGPIPPLAPVQRRPLSRRELRSGPLGRRAPFPPPSSRASRRRWTVATEVFIERARPESPGPCRAARTVALRENEERAHGAVVRSTELGALNEVLRPGGPVRDLEGEHVHLPRYGIDPNADRRNIERVDHIGGGDVDLDGGSGR